MSDRTKRIAYIDFPDSEGLTIEIPRKGEQENQTAQQAVPQIPPDLAPRAEHPLEKIAREHYEQRARASFARGLTVPKVTLPGATWSDAIRMGLEWLFESGVSRKVYRDGTPQVQDMKYAHRVVEAREFFYRKNAKALQDGQPPQPVTNYSGSFYPLGLFRAGNNPTQQFVGSYNIDIYPAQNNRIMFVLTNVTSWKSGTYHLGDEYPRGMRGFGGNQTQIYTWTEPVRLRTY